jgi:nucleoside transporter
MLLRTRLAAMMFLEYAIWGAWAPILGQDLTHLNFSGIQIGWIYSLLPLACMISPFVGGQFADRIMPTQVFLGIAHLGGAVALWYMAAQTDFPSMLVVMLIWSLLFAPTLALTNSICFIHLKNNEREFPLIRTMGTIGWIAAGALLTYWRLHPGIISLPGRIDSLSLTAVASLLLGILSFGLPHTPPNREAKNPWAFLEALKLFQNPRMAFFLVLCMIATSEFQFFYILSAPFLANVGVTEALIPITKTVSQGCEILVLAVLLPILLPWLGVRWSLFIGLAAWPLRYLIFALGKPLWLVIASLGLHGFGFAFYFVVAFMYIDRVAPKDIRGSAQALIMFCTYGLGMFLGSLFCGWVKDAYTPVGGPANWTMVFVVPTIITTACAIAHLSWFRESGAKKESR